MSDLDNWVFSCIQVSLSVVFDDFGCAAFTDSYVYSQIKVWAWELIPTPPNRHIKEDTAQSSPHAMTVRKLRCSPRTGALMAPAW